MQARTLNRDSWHFKLAKKLGTVHFKEEFNYQTQEWETYMYPISVCAYVRSIIFKTIFLALVVALGIVFSISMTYGIYLFFSIKPDQMSEIQKMFSHLGLSCWGIVFIFSAAFLLGYVISEAKQKIRQWRYARSESKEVPDSFFTHIKAVYKEKICYMLK